jgi:hypothetical protein
MSTAEGNVETERRANPESASGAARPMKDRPTKKKRRPPVDEEETPVIGGRFLIALGLVAVGTIIPHTKLGEVLEPKGPEPTNMESWSVGGVSTVRITLVTADVNLLACASEQSFDGAHCGFKTTNEAWPRDPSKPQDDNKLDIIQPYRTWFDNKLLFVAGLWAQPEVAYRVHQEPTHGIQADKLARFAVECRVRFLGRFDSVKLRWNPQQSWSDPDTGATWAGRAEFCKLIDEPQ